jgi:hypothetical protein
VKVRWLIDVLGPTNGDPNGFRRGQVAEIDDTIARRYLEHGYVTQKLDGDLPRPYVEQAGGSYAIGSGVPR